MRAPKSKKSSSVDVGRARNDAVRDARMRLSSSHSRPAAAVATPDKMIKDLLDKGFKKKQEVKLANLEDVFIDLTGKDLRE